MSRQWGCSKGCFVKGDIPVDPFLLRVTVGFEQVDNPGDLLPGWELAGLWELDFVDKNSVEVVDLEIGQGIRVVQWVRDL